ncbi:MAG: DUF4271 domain-containing protein [Bacteroidota bacterium]|nr:DUF4271 domain-containing protein [Bacteroidota bacterium]
MKIKAAVIFLFIFLLFYFYPSCLLAQLSQDTAGLSRDTINTSNVDSSSIISIDSVAIKSDSSLASLAVLPPKVKSYWSVVNNLLSINKVINVKDAPVFFIVEKKKFSGKEFVFYSLGILVLVLGIFKTSYRSYFNNIFRVFFNTSLRQTQLTDQLEQAKLPSFLLNIFFSISTGVFIWLLFTIYHPPSLVSRQLLLPFCILAIGVLYFMKYCILKFIGWVSGMQEITNSYIFIIFLVNKILGIVLVPFIIILAFSQPLWMHYVTTISLLVVLLFFLSRYFKTYGILENRFPMNAFHFAVYIAATEIFPLLILYKVTIDYLL